MTIIAALAALLPLAGRPVEQDAVTSVRTDQVSICKPANAAAKKIGDVEFKLNPGERNLDFITPAAWQTPVVVNNLNPPQDPPTVILQWRPREGEALLGQINWRDDTGEAPSTFAVRLGTKGNNLLWAKWLCKVRS